MRINLTSNISEAEYNQLRDEVLTQMESVLEYRVAESYRLGAEEFVRQYLDKIVALGKKPTRAQCEALEKELQAGNAVLYEWWIDEGNKICAEELEAAREELTERVQAAAWKKKTQSR